MCVADYDSSIIGTMKHVPGGTFSRDGQRMNRSTVSSFWMAVYPVTRAQWVRVMGEGTDPSSTIHSSGLNDPVQMVSWYDAVDFCNKLSSMELMEPVYVMSERTPKAGHPITDASVRVDWHADGYRLPTEMEWMWAAMGAQDACTKAFAGSTGSNAIGDYAVFGYAGTEVGRTVHERTCPVGSKLPNELGLYDISGNVWEWCWDLYGDYPSGLVENYKGVHSGEYRMPRGGGWLRGSKRCAVADRDMDLPDDQFNDIGFRVVKSETF